MKNPENNDPKTNNPHDDMEEVNDNYYPSYFTLSAEDQADYHGQYEEAKYFMEEQNAAIVEEHSVEKFCDLTEEAQQKILANERSFNSVYGYNGSLASRYTKASPAKDDLDMEKDSPEPDFDDR